MFHGKEIDAMPMTREIDELKSVTGVMPTRWHWTDEEFCRMGDRGDFEGQNVILVDGDILQMPPANDPHDIVLGLIDYRLKSLFGSQFWVRVQMGLRTALDTNPVPDIAVVAGSPRDYVSGSVPTQLVIEVSDTSIRYDLGDKAFLYAVAGIKDYWVIDVNEQVVYQFRDPISDHTQQRGYRYDSMQRYTTEQFVSPLVAEESVIAVSELFP